MYVTGPRRDGVTSGRAVSNFLPGPRGHRTAFPPQASDQGSTPQSHLADSQHAVVRPTVVYSRLYAQRASYSSGPWGERLTEKEEKKRNDKKRTTLPLHDTLLQAVKPSPGPVSAALLAWRPSGRKSRSAGRGRQSARRNGSSRSFSHLPMFLPCETPSSRGNPYVFNMADY